MSIKFAPPTISCIFVELTRFTKTEAECDCDLDWLFYIFRQGSVVEELVEEHRSGFTGELLRACEVAGFDKKKKLIFEQDMIQEMDKLAEDNFAKRVAMEKGREQERQILISKLLQFGMTPETIAKATGLPVETVLNYRS